MELWPGGSMNRVFFHEVWSHLEGCLVATFIVGSLLHLLRERFPTSPGSNRSRRIAADEPPPDADPVGWGNSQTKEMAACLEGRRRHQMTTGPQGVDEEVLWSRRGNDARCSSSFSCSKTTLLTGVARPSQACEGRIRASLGAEGFKRSEG